MTLRASIDADPLTVFLRTDDFAETVTYKPHRHRGDATVADRSIVANVVRMQLESQDQVGAIVSVFEVSVHNNAATGISGDELDRGGDKISFATKTGEAATDHAVIRLVTQDHGMLVLECQ